MPHPFLNGKLVGTSRFTRYIRKRVQHRLAWLGMGSHLPPEPSIEDSAKAAYGSVPSNVAEPRSHRRDAGTIDTTPRSPEFAGRIEHISDGRVTGFLIERTVSSSPRETELVVEFRSGMRQIGQSIVGPSSPDREGFPFEAFLAVYEKTAVSAFRQSDMRELVGSPFYLDVQQQSDGGFPAAWTARARELKYFNMPVSEEVAVLVTHTTDGTLKPHVLPYMRRLTSAGVEVLLVIAADKPVYASEEILKLAAGVLERENLGYDFAAWAHTLKLYPDLYSARMLLLINDSVIVSEDQQKFDRLMQRVRDSGAALVGLTESRERNWHIQSYFLALKPFLLSSYSFHHFVSNIVILPSKEDVISRYELLFSQMAINAGLQTSVLYQTDIAGNPTLFAWRYLLFQDFPFVKVSLLGRRFPHIDLTGVETVLNDAGFDVDIVNQVSRTSPVAGTAALQPSLAQSLGSEGRPLRVAYLGSWDLAGPNGEASRRLVSRIRHTRFSVNLLPIAPRLENGFADQDPGIADFIGAADVAVVDLKAGERVDLNEAQRRVLASAGQRIGFLSSICPAASLSAQAIEGMDRVWIENALPKSSLAGCSIPFDTISSAADIEECLAEVRVSSVAGKMPQCLRLNLTAGITVSNSSLCDCLTILPVQGDGSPFPESSGDAVDVSGLAARWLVIAPMDAILAPSICDRLAQAVFDHPDIDIFYADDVATECPDVSDRLRLKPQIDRTLLAAQDYVGAPLFVRADHFLRLGGLRLAARTAAIADFIHRALRAQSSIARIPEVLLAYPKCRVAASDTDFINMLKVQEENSNCTVLPGLAPHTFLIARQFNKSSYEPVTLIIPTCRTVLPTGRGTYIEQLLTALANTAWPMQQLHVIVGDDVSNSPDWAERAWPFALTRLATPRGANERFNYASKMNRLWRECQTEQLVFINDDVLPNKPDWLQALQTFAVDRSVGGVGARLLFEDGTLQHAGMAPHGASVAHLWIHHPRDSKTYQDWALTQREWSMVTGAVFATRKSVMEEVNGFDEHFALEYNDTDLCLRLRTLGYRIVYTPDAEMVHAEKASRGNAPCPGADMARFLTRWGSYLGRDPSWHPSLDRNRNDMVPELPPPSSWYLEA